MEPLRTADTIRVPVLQGQAHVSGDASMVFGTVLGSCVALCLYDADVRVGGMNHFLLPEPPGGHAAAKIDVHYGVYLMEILINQLLALGASKNGMRARLYGGANLHAGMTEIGTANANFARNFLERERVPLAFADLGGRHARRIEFRPAGGQVRCLAIPEAPMTAERPEQRPKRANGDVELF
jgi:chemotaxis protein CheD